MFKQLTHTFLTAAVLAVTSAGSWAAAPGGPADGAYACTFTVPGVATVQQFVAITGKQDGTSVAVFPATQPSHVITGYGVGVATNGSFTGKSDKQQPFNITYTANTLSGTFGYVTGSSVITVSANCTRVF